MTRSHAAYDLASRLAAGVVSFVLTLSAPVVSEADSEKCRATILTASAGYADARAKSLSKCEDRILAGKLDAATVCSADSATNARIDKAAAKLHLKIDAACGGRDRACGDGGDDVDLTSAGWGSGSCPDIAQSGCTMPINNCSDVASCLECIGDAATTGSLNLVAGEMNVTPSRSRDVASCQRAAVKQYGKLFSARVKYGSRCWRNVIKGKALAPCPVPGDGRTGEVLDAATDKFVSSVCQACGGSDRACDAAVGDAAGSGANNDLAIAEIGAAGTCEDWVVPVSAESCSGPIANVSDFVNCILCAVSYTASCAETAAVPSESAYPSACNDSTPPPAATDYFVDSLSGDDSNSGTEMGAPWLTLAKVTAATFRPGDRVLFRRGSSYTGCVTINGNGSSGAPITVAAYSSGNAPSFTNPDPDECDGNAMRVRGDYQVVEDLYFHHTAPAPDDSGFERVWAAGALHVSPGNDHVIIRNNEFASTPKAIQSYSQHSLITGNYIHDTNTAQSGGMLSAPWWGPIGIQLGIGNQEVSCNTIENMYAVGGEFGADGGAIEIDDGRNHKDNIHIHHNMTSRNMGFIEVSWWDDIAKMASSNISIHHNTSLDFQSFVLWWAPTTGSVIENNTIIRTDNEYTGPFAGVFFMDAPPSDIQLAKNIVVTDNDLTEAIFVEGFDGGVDDVDHFDNLYWDIVDGVVDLGLPFGAGEVVADPMFVDAQGGDYRLQPGSPAAGWGAWVED